MRGERVSQWDRALIDETVRQFIELEQTERAVAILRLSVYQKTQLAGLLARIIREVEAYERKKSGCDIDLHDNGTIRKHGQRDKRKGDNDT